MNDDDDVDGAESDDYSSGDEPNQAPIKRKAHHHHPKVCNKNNKNRNDRNGHKVSKHKKQKNVVIHNHSHYYS